ncbi:MAG: peroxiredoxin [Acidobacteria bacterium]|nr:peroxiredoxin [Acidobacteriota bacterium]
MSDPMLGKGLPSCVLKTNGGNNVELPKACVGTWTVLYFYPKDDTPGCTKQACAYRDHLGEFKSIGAQVFGVSLDDEHSHDSFVDKFSLNFPLLADTKHVLSEALGVYGDQEWMGKTFKGLSRDTFIINPEGKIVKVWRKVDPLSTMAETFNAVKELQA